MSKWIFCLLLSLPALAADKESESLHQFQVGFRTDAGKLVKLVDWKGKRLVLTMLYTSCGSTCPMTIRKLKELQKALDEKQQEAEFLIFTMDPKVDTPAHLADYRKKHELKQPNWTFLTGREADTRKLSVLLGIKFRRNSISGEIMHDNKIILLDPEGRIVRVLGSLSAPLNSLFEAGGDKKVD